MATNKGYLLVVSGPSGSGKGTLCESLLCQNADVQYSISATTRPMRKGEIDGVNYFFLTKEEFEKAIQNQEFLEYAKVHDNYYGTPKKAVEEAIACGLVVLLEIDVQGAMQLKKLDIPAVFVFIAPPSLKELEKRLITRGTDEPDVIAKRVFNAREEMTYQDQYDYVIVNDVLEEAQKALNAIVLAERYRN